MLLAPLLFWIGAIGAVGIGKRAEAVIPSPGYQVGQQYPGLVKPVLVKFRASGSSPASLSALQPGDKTAEFDTIQDTGMNPPDGAIAAGPSQLLIAANNALQVRSLTGNLLFDAKLTDTFNPVISDILDFDITTWLPEYRNCRLSFDPVSRRFFFLTNVVVHPVEPNTGQRVDASGCILLVSVDSDAFHGWYTYAFITSRSDATPATPISAGALTDPGIPTERAGMTAMGSDKSAIYLSFDMQLTNTGTFTGNETFILDKAKALKGEGIEPKVIHDIFVPRGPLTGQPTPFDLYATGLRPVDGATTAAPGLIMNYHPTAGLVMYKIKDALTTPVVENVILHGMPYPPAPPALQPPTSTTPLPTGGTELHKTSYRNGLIYTAHTVGNALDTSIGPAQIHWYVVDPAAGTLKWQGTIADAAQSFFHPSFVPDNFGRGVLVFHSSGPLNVPRIQHASFD